jgi:uncharacterized membrane protein
MDLLLIILRLVHIFGAIYWAGTAFFLMFVFSPTVAKATEPERAILGKITANPMLVPSIAASGGLTVLAGLILYFRYWLNSPDAMTSNAVKVFGIGGLAGIIALIIGGAFVGRLTRKMGALGAQAASAGGPPSADLRSQIGATMASLQQWSKINFVFIVIAVFCMAIARHVG